MSVVLGDPSLCVEHQHDDVGILDRLQRLDHRKLLDRLVHFAAAAQAGGVDQGVMTRTPVEVQIQRIARRARFAECDDTLLAEKRIDQCRLADIGTPHDCDRDPSGSALVRVFLQLGCGVLATEHERRFRQLTDVFAMRRRYRNRSSQAQLVKFCRRVFRCQALALVDCEHDRPSRATEHVCDGAVVCDEPFTAVNHEYHGVCFRDRSARLLRHGMHDSVCRLGLEPSGVDDDAGTLANACASVVAMVRSSPVRPSRPSTRNITASASAIAILVCAAIACMIPLLALGSNPPVSTTR